MALRSLDDQLSSTQDGDAIISYSTFSSDAYTTQSLLDRVTSPMLVRRQDGQLSADGVGLLLQSLLKLDGQLDSLQQEVSARAASLRRAVAADADAYMSRVAAIKGELAALHKALAELERRGGAGAQVASRVGPRLEAAEAQRRRALEGAAALDHLREFAAAADPSSLPQLFHDEGRMAEAAGIAGQLSLVVGKVLESRGRAAAAAAASQRRGSLDGPPPRRGPPPPGSLEAAAEQLELYRNVLDNRVVSRFDAALEEQDLPAMAACARVMAAAGGHSDSLLVSRYISTRPLFSDPKVVAAARGGGAGGVSTPANPAATATPQGGKALQSGSEADGGADASTSAAAAMRALTDLYRSLSSSLRDEAVVMEQVFPDPGAATAALVQRVFEQPVAAALDAALRPPPADAPLEVLRSHLRLLAEAYRKTRALAEEAADLAGGAAPAPADLADSACGAALGRHLALEQRWVAALGRAKVAGAKRSLSRDLILDVIAINEEAVKRCLAVSQPGQAAAAVRLLFHSGGGGGGGGGNKGPPATVCLLGQAATHILLGLGAAGDACAKRLVGAFRPGGGDVNEAARADVGASFGVLMQAAGAAAGMVALLKQYHDRGVAPHVECSPDEAAACAQGLAELVAAAEGRAGAALQRSVAQFSRRLDLTLAAEQRRADFRPAAAEAFAADLDRPTDACVTVTALLAALGALARASLHGSNLASFLDALGRHAAAALQIHMLRFTFSPEGALRWKRDVAEYAACVVGRLGVRGVAAAAFEELGALAAVLIVGPEAVLGLVEGTLGLSPAQALRYVERREDFRMARVGDRPLAALFTGQG